MGKMEMLKERLLDELLSDMDEHEAMKLAPKKEVSVMSVHAEPDKDEMGGVSDQDADNLNGEEDEEDEEDLKRLLAEYGG